MPQRDPFFAVAVAVVAPLPRWAGRIGAWLAPPLLLLFLVATGSPVTAARATATATPSTATATATVTTPPATTTATAAPTVATTTATAAPTVATTEASPGCAPLIRTPTQAAPSGEKALLYRLRRGEDGESYLFGTIHVGDRRVLALPSAVRKAFAASRRFVMEAKVTEEAMRGLAKAMKASGSGQGPGQGSGQGPGPEPGKGEGSKGAQGLAGSLGPPLLQRAQGLLARYGVDGEIAARLPPWAAYLLLNQPRPQREVGLPLDFSLMKMAAESGKDVQGLETLDEQMASLSGLAAADQSRLLSQTVCHYDQIQLDLVELVDLYVAHDLPGLFATLHRYEPDPTGADERLAASLLWRRNERMLARMAPYLREGGAFVAVGALHLPGDLGLLALLRKEGYAVTAVQ